MTLAISGYADFSYKALDSAAHGLSTAYSMLVNLYVEALLADPDLADQVWEL